MTQMQEVMQFLLSLRPGGNRLRIRRNVALWAAFTTGILLILGWCFVVLTPSGPSALAHKFHSYVLEWNSSEIFYGGQRRGYLAIVVLVTLLMLLAPVFAKVQKGKALPSLNWFIARITTAFLVTFLGICYFSTRLELMVLALCAVPALYLCGWALAKRVSTKDYQLIFGALAVVMFLPGLLVPLDLSGQSPQHIADIQTHFSQVIGPGDRLAAGHRLFKEVSPGYGLLLPVVSCGLQKLFGSFSFGDYMTILRGMQILSFLAAGYLYIHHGRGFAFPSFIALVFLLPWLHTNQLSLLYPNHSPWRLLGFPIALLILFAMRRVDLRLAGLLLGFTAGAAILINLETGVAIAAGLLAFVCFHRGIQSRNSSWKRIQSISTYLIGCVFAFAAYYALVWVLLGYQLEGSTFSRVDRLAIILQSGFTGSLQLTFQPIAILMFLHAVYCLLKLSWSGAAGLGFRCACRVAIAAMLLLWFSYYITRPETMYLSALYFLYGFLLVDLARSMLLYLKKRTVAVEPPLWLACAFCMVVLPTIYLAFESESERAVLAVKQLLRGPANPPATLVSGVYLPATAAAELREKANFIRENGGSSPPMYLTSHSFLLPKLSGVHSSIKRDDVFTNMPLVADSDALVEKMVTAGPDKIYFDAPSIALDGGPHRKACFDYLKTKLSNYYQPVGITSGWEVWVRTKVGS